MKVFINPGHDINLDSGAVNPIHGTRECDVARDAGKMLSRYLETVGCEVRTLQDDDLGLVCSESNNWGADIFVSLHCNSFNTKARGTETLYKSSNGQRLAQCIQEQEALAMGIELAKQKKLILFFQQTPMAIGLELRFGMQKQEILRF